MNGCGVYLNGSNVSADVSVLALVRNDDPNFVVAYEEIRFPDGQTRTVAFFTWSDADGSPDVNIGVEVPNWTAALPEGTWQVGRNATLDAKGV